MCTGDKKRGFMGEAGSSHRACFLFVFSLSFLNANQHASPLLVVVSSWIFLVNQVGKSLKWKEVRVSSISWLRLSTSASVKSRVIDPGFRSTLSAQCIFCPEISTLKILKDGLNFHDRFRRENSKFDFSWYESFWWQKIHCEMLIETGICANTPHQFQTQNLQRPRERSRPPRN